MLYALLVGSALGLCLVAAPVRADLSEVRVNEFVASNAMGLTDEDGEFSDWIELHNTGAKLVSLGGAFLTDDATNLVKWAIPAVDLAAGEFLVIFASNKNRTTPGAELHTNFRLGAGGEYLGLIAPDGTTVIYEYAPAFPAQATDIAYGVGPGGATGFFDPPTPGAANPSTFLEAVLPVEFSVPHGIYDAPVNVGMSTATPGAEIRYTTDGSLPQAGHGTVYTAPVAVSTTTVLRVGAFKTGLQPSRVASHSLIFPAAVLTQTGAGFPSTWGIRAVDYAMDPMVVNDPQWSGEMLDALVAIPSVSLVTDIADLFGPNGIYANPRSRGDAWERLASMELIYPGGGAGFATSCGLEIHGNTSRSLGNPKQSMRVTFKAAYGPSTLSFPLFPGSSVTEHKSLVLRAGWQDGWQHARARALYLRDQYASDTQLALGQVAVHGFFVHLYLNGLYWGVYDLHERATEEFAAFHYGGDSDDWDVMKDGQLDAGERVAWDTLFGMMTPDVGTPGGYAAVQEYLDVDNLIDFVMTHHYLGNLEWAGSWVAARRDVPGETFKFVSWDGERTLRSPRRIPGLSGSGRRPQGAYGTLRRFNADFRATFAQHVQQHYFNGGALTPEAATARFMARADELSAPLLAESARWGDGARAGQPYTRNDWIAQRDRLLAEFFPVRSAIVVERYQQLGLYP